MRPLNARPRREPAPSTRPALFEPQPPLVRRASLRERALWLTLLAVLLGGPLAFGGAPLVVKQWLFLGCWAALVLAVPSLQGWRGGWLGVSAVVFLVWGTLQLVPLPVGVLQRLSPAGYELRQAIDAALMETTGAAAPLTLDAEGTLVGLMHFGACALVFFVTASMPAPRRAVVRLADILIVVGVAQAVYALAVGLLVGPTIWGWTNIHAGSRLHGTYVNPNNFAGLLAVLIPVALGRAGMFAWPALPGGNLARRLAYLLDQREVSLRVLYYIAAGVMLCGVLLSASRGAFLALAAGLVAYVGVGALATKHLRRAFASALALGVVAVPLAYLVGAELLRSRLEGAWEGLAGRMTIWQGAAEVARDYWASGAGLGSFGSVYMRYHPHVMTQHVYHAHADLLEIPVEVGAPVALCLLLGGLWLMARGLTCLRVARETAHGALVVGLMASCVVIFVRATIDFDLQMMGSALVYSAVAGALCALAHERPPGPALVPWLAAGLCLLALCFAPARLPQHEIRGLWAVSARLDAEIEAGAREIAVAMGGSPDAAVLVAVGRLAMRQRAQERIAAVRAALLDAYRRRAAIAPADGQNHAAYAYALSRASQPDRALVRRHAHMTLRQLSTSRGPHLTALFALLRVDRADPDARARFRAMVAMPATSWEQRRMIEEGLPIGVGEFLAAHLPNRWAVLDLVREADLQGDMEAVRAGLERLAGQRGEATHVVSATLHVSGARARAVAVARFRSGRRQARRYVVVTDEPTAVEVRIRAPWLEPGAQPELLLAAVLHPNEVKCPGTRLVVADLAVRRIED